MKKEYYIGYKFKITDKDYIDISNWCNLNNAKITIINNTNCIIEKITVYKPTIEDCFATLLYQVDKDFQPITSKPLIIYNNNPVSCDKALQIMNYLAFSAEEDEITIFENLKSQRNQARKYIKSLFN